MRVLVMVWASVLWAGLGSGRRRGGSGQTGPGGRPPALGSGSKENLTEAERALITDEVPSQAQLCANFTGQGGPLEGLTGAELRQLNYRSQRLSSPFYPQAYPAALDCVRLIEAPPGFDVSLDFRGETFAVEHANSQPHDCPYDYLEARDGRYGFSPLIGRFCGLDFPRAVLRATSGAMWLHFHSDATLQYQGFSAEFQFLPSEEEPGPECIFESHPTNEDGVITTGIMRAFYNRFANGSDSLDCVWNLRAVRDDFRLRIFFPSFRLAQPNDCEGNFMEVYAGATLASARLIQLCGLTAKTMNTRSASAFVRIHLSKEALVQTVIFAVYSGYLPSGNCSEYPGLFFCGDDTCVDDSLVCNGRPNCLYDKEELSCGPVETAKTPPLRGAFLPIFLVVLGCILAIIVCSLIVNLVPACKPSTKYTGLSLQPSNIAAQQRLRGAETPPLPRVPDTHQLVYSTLVPGPDKGPAADRLLEILPKPPDDDLHLMLCAADGCDLNAPHALHRELQRSERRRNPSAQLPPKETRRDEIHIPTPPPPPVPPKPKPRGSKKRAVLPLPPPPPDDPVLPDPPSPSAKSRKSVKFSPYGEVRSRSVSPAQTLSPFVPDPFHPVLSLPPAPMSTFRCPGEREVEVTLEDRSHRGVQPSSSMDSLEILSLVESPGERPPRSILRRNISHSSSPDAFDARIVDL